MQAKIICTPDYAHWLHKFGEPRHPRRANAWGFRQKALTPNAVELRFGYQAALPPYKGT